MTTRLDLRFDRRKERRVGKVVWHGTLREQLDLMAAVQHNCGCRFDVAGGAISACEGHSMLTGDQRALNGLLWIRRQVRRLLAEEGLPLP
jgi:hypothetical protein